MRDYPRGVLRVYDNGGKTIDRYTVYFNRPERAYGFSSCVGMNGEPFHPMGICQHSMGMLGRHNGKVINFSELPPDCRRVIERDLKDDN